MLGTIISSAGSHPEQAGAVLLTQCCVIVEGECRLHAVFIAMSTSLITIGQQSEGIKNDDQCGAFVQDNGDSDRR